MGRERLGRVTRAALFLVVGFQGLATPMAGVAVRGSMPECVTASPLAALVGAAAHIITASPDCIYGTYAPGDSYQALAGVVLTASMAASLFGLCALVSAVGLGLSTKQMLRRVSRWFSHRFRIVVAALPFVSAARPVPVLVTPRARPSRVASRPQLRRGPPTFCC